MRYYQQECDAAIAECTDNRCVVKMFCGTGKSKIMSEGRFLAGAKLVVYVFPSLALIDQFTRQYLGDVDAAHLLCVSSEAGATTTPETIQRFFTCNEFTRDDGTGNTRRIVCVTYQSMHTLFENMGETVVDVCCYDEAHHVVAPSYQSHVFSNAAIRKQVFFTATPVNENGVVMYDSDFSRDSDFPGSSEKLTCGPLVYEYTYLRGVDEGYLNPFDVRVDFFMASAIDNESFFTTETMASSTLAGKMYKSIARAVITSGNTRVLTFHADVNADRDLSVSNFVNEELMKRAFDHVYRTEFPEILVADRIDGNLRMVALSASTSPRDRAAILAEFDATPDKRVYIVSSCRTIGEGIDTKHANMCVFVDPKSSPLSIIQNIGRIVRKLPGVSKPRSTILIPCAVDREKYTACDTDEKRDVAIRSDLSLPTGNFNRILSVLCALRQEDEELYNACLRSGGSGGSVHAGDDSSYDACDDSGSDTDESGGVKSSGVSDRGRSRELSSCTFSVHTDPDVKVLWRLSDLDLSKTVASAVIDCEVVKYDPMERAREIVDRANARVAGGGAQLPRHLFKPKNESQEQESKDAQRLDDWKKTLKGKGKLCFSDSVCEYLDEQLSGWRDNLDEMAIQEARAIVGRASKRVAGGGAPLPRSICKPKNDTEKQEVKDASKLGDWKKALKGKGSTRCPDTVRDFLDEELVGWRDVRDLDENAIKEARAIVGRASERVAGGGAQLPCYIYKPKNDTEKQEVKDATKLNNWRAALKGVKSNRCSDTVRDFLDVELPGWRDVRDLDENAIKEARAIVERAKERVARGGAQLPRGIKNPKSDAEKQEKLDASKLGCWKQGLKGTGKWRCPDAVRDFLDLELPGWRDARRKNNEKRPLPVSQVASTVPVHPPSSAMIVEPAAPVVVPTKLVTKKRKKTMLLPSSCVAAPPALEEGDAKRPARSAVAQLPKSELSVLHQRYKSLTSENLAAEFAAHPAAWHAYHALSEKNEESFPTDEIPRNVVIRKLAELRTRRAKSVVDLGCGKAWIARHFLDDPRFAFTNFDHVACNALVTKCDISALPLDDDSTEIAILCLAMWGSNCASYVGEAYRVLETHGLLYVVEPTRRWLDESCCGGGVPIHRLRAVLETCGFKIMEERIEKFSVFVCCKT